MIMDRVLEVFIGLIFLAILVVVIVGTIDVYGNYKAEPAKIACAQKQMDSFRYSLSDSVVCVPYRTRQDTLTVKK